MIAASAIVLDHRSPHGVVTAKAGTQHSVSYREGTEYWVLVILRQTGSGGFELRKPQACYTGRQGVGAGFACDDASRLLFHSAAIVPVARGADRGSGGNSGDRSAGGSPGVAGARIA